MQTAGTIIAIIISIIALVHSIWAHKNSNICDYLHSKHERAYSLKQTVMRISAPIAQTKAEIKIMSLKDPNFTDTPSEKVDELVNIASKSIIEIAYNLQSEYERNKDIFEPNDGDKINAQLEDFDQKYFILEDAIKNDENIGEATANLAMSAIEIEKLMESATTSVLENTAKKLQNKCGI